MPTSTDVVRVRFDTFELDEANASLLREGKPVALAPTPFAVLCALVRQPGSLLGKNALLDEVWGHRFVSESVLKTAISEIRTALRDDPRQPRFIETVSRRGYRFIAVATAISTTQPERASVSKIRSMPAPSFTRSGSAGTSTSRSVSTGTSDSETRSESRSWSTSRGETAGRSEGLVPILAELPTAVFSLEEQRHKKAAFLRDLRRQEAVVKTPERPSVAFRTARVEPGIAHPERVERGKRDAFVRSPFAKPTRAVDALLRARRSSLERAARAKAAPQNPDDFLE